MHVKLCVKQTEYPAAQAMHKLNLIFLKQDTVAMFIFTSSVFFRKALNSIQVRTKHVNELEEISHHIKLPLR